MGRTAVAEVGDVEVEGEGGGEEAVGQDERQQGRGEEEGQEEVVEDRGEEEEGEECVAVDVKGVAPLHFLLHADLNELREGKGKGKGKGGGRR